MQHFSINSRSSTKNGHAQCLKTKVCRTDLFLPLILTRSQCHTAAAEGAKLSTIAMGRACVVGAGGAVGAPPGDAPAGGAPAGGAPAGGAPARGTAGGAGWTGGAACSGGKGWAANMPNAPNRGKARRS